MYNLTAITDNSGGMMELIKAVNDLTGKTLFGGLTFILFLLMFVPGLRYGWKTALLGSSGVMSILSLLLFTAGLIPQGIMFIYLLLLFAGVLMSMITDQ